MQRNRKPLYVVNPVTDGTIPMGSSQVGVGVTPVAQVFSINNQPSPPYPQNPLMAGRVAFGDNPPNGRNPNTIYAGYQSFGVNPGAQNPLARVQDQAAAVFFAQVFNVPAPGAAGSLHFIQNVTIINGMLGIWQNAWTFAAGGPPPENWVWMVGGKAISTQDHPLLDAIPQDIPYYTARPPLVNGNNVLLVSGDGPYASLEALEAKGLGANRNYILTGVGWIYGFSLYLVWSMPAGGGQQGDVIYTLGGRNWNMTFDAFSSKVNGWADVISRYGLPGSGIFSPGDFILTHKNPVVIGPTALQSVAIR